VAESTNTDNFLGPRLREGAFIGVSAVCLYLMLALFTYSPRDPGWSATGSGANIRFELESERYRILLTVVPPKPSRDEEEAREALQSLPLFDTSIRRLVAFQKAAGFLVCRSRPNRGLLI